MDDLIARLTQIGFSPKEAAVYFAALQLEVGSAPEIALLAHVNRATTYSVLRMLQKKGLVTEITSNGEHKFAAESPEIIHSLLAIEEQELHRRKQIAAPIVNRLHVFFRQKGTKPKIRYVESLEGLRIMQQEYESIGEDMIQIVGLDTFETLYGNSANEDHQGNLQEQGRKLRSILVTDQDVSFPPGFPIQFVTISPSLVSIKGEMTVCGDRVALFSYADGLVAIDITSATIANMVRSTLELAWKEAERLSFD